MAEDIVGLRFVSTGYNEVQGEITRYSRSTEMLVSSVNRAAESANTHVQGLFNEAKAYAQSTAALRKLSDMMRANARANQEAITKLTSLEQANTSAKASADAFVIGLRAQELATQKAARASQVQIQQLLGVNQNYKSAKASADVFSAAQTKVTASYDRLRQSIDPTFAAQMRMKRAHDTVRQALAQETITRQQAAATLRQYRASLAATGASTAVATSASGRLAAQFLATANTIAILDGPLGGVASRFSAFGVLLNRSTMLLAGAAVAVTALGAAAFAGVRSYTLFEAQSARINAILTTTRNQVGLTSTAIERMGSSIALATLENETGVRNAIAQLLTFRKVSGEVFEDVLKTAADMSALGFGTIESESVKLAKALQDPRQSLASLSRSGITFTRQQRALIVSLVETGQQAEAMSRILANVNGQVGGAGEAAARETMAGNFDTIGQAISTAARALGEFVANEMGLRRVLELAATAADNYVTDRTDPNRLLNDLTSQRAAMAARTPVTGILSTAMLQGGEVVASRQIAELARLDALISAEQRRLVIIQQTADAQRIVARSTDLQANVADLEAEIDLRRQTIGLTSQQAEVQKILGGLGLSIFPEDIPQRVAEFADGLRDAGMQGREIERAVDTFSDSLQDAVDRGAEVATVLEQISLSRKVVSMAESLTQENEILAAQMALVREGVGFAEARTQAEAAIQFSLAEQLLAISGNDAAMRDLVDSYFAGVQANKDLTAEADAAEASANRLAAAAGRVADAFAAAAGSSRSLENRLSGARARLTTLEAGGSESEARLSEDLEQRRIVLAPALNSSDSLTRIGAELELRADEENLRALSEATERSDAIIASRRDTDAGSGSGAARSGGAAREVASITSITGALEQEIDKRRELMGMHGEERSIRESYYDLVKELDTQATLYTEAELMRAAAVIAARNKQIDQIEEIEQMNKRAQQSAADAFTAFVTGSKSANDAAKDLLVTLAQMLANRAFTQLADRFMPGLFSAFAPVGAGGASAQGNVFGGGSIVPFARGGVVDGPTMFPMAGGRNGLMGEVGPEAIMPLTRTASGDLGVHVTGARGSGGSGSGGGTIEIVLHAPAGFTGEQMNAVEGVAVRIVAREAPGLTSRAVSASQASFINSKNGWRPA